MENKCISCNKTNRHVAFLVNSLNGLFCFRFELVQRLIRDGYRVSILAPSNGVAKFFSALGCNLININVERRGKNPLLDFKVFLQYLVFMMKHKPNIVLTYTVKPNIFGGFACRVLNVPQISNVTGLGNAVENPGFLENLVLILSKLSFTKNQIIFFQNVSNLNYFKIRNLVKNDQVRLISGSGVNLLQFCFKPFPVDNSIKLIFIGRIIKEKGILELFEAISRIRERYSIVTCDIVGYIQDSQLNYALEAFTSTGSGNYLGLSNNIHGLLSEYHAVVLPSYHEGMSNVLLEAAATGRPVLTSNVPGCRETFDEGISGFGFEPRSVDSLVQAIERFIALPHEQKAAMGLAGRKKMEREFDRQIVVDAYMREIENILEENNKKDKKK